MLRPIQTATTNDWTTRKIGVPKNRANASALRANQSLPKGAQVQVRQVKTEVVVGLPGSPAGAGVFSAVWLMFDSVDSVFWDLEFQFYSPGDAGIARNEAAYARR